MERGQLLVVISIMEAPTHMLLKELKLCFHIASYFQREELIISNYLISKTSAGTDDYFMITLLAINDTSL